LVNRDAGCLQIYCANSQEILDWIIQLYKICEKGNVSLPGIVAYDGFIVSHVAEVVEIPKQEDVDSFLPPLGKSERPLLEVGNPIQFGVILQKEYYPDYEYKKHTALRDSLSVIKEVNREFGDKFGRYYDVIEPVQTDDADIIFIGMGALTNPAKWVVNKLRKEGKKVGLVNLRVFRPFPGKELVEACRNAKALAVLDRSIGYGTSGLLYPDVVRVFYNQDTRPRSFDFIIGLGGKEINEDTIMKCYDITTSALKKKDVDAEIFWPDARTNEGVD
jgi:2-oxoisovalerate ferredoxin oxidoreductase alpha subunit